MTILLTGATGQLGSEIVQLARLWQLPLIGFDHQHLDITRRNPLAQMFKHIRPRIVINAAAYTAVDRAEQEPAIAYAVNSEGVGLLAQLCRDQDIPLIHVSTDYVFSGSKGSPYVESDPPAPINIYGYSKLAGEQRIRQILSRYIILRTSWVFGRHGRNFVTTVLRLSREGKPLRIVCDQIGGPTASRRLAECLLQMTIGYLRDGELAWGTYHFSGRPYITWYGFAEAIVQEASAIGLIPAASIVPIKSHEFQLKAPRPRDSRLLGRLPPEWPYESPPHWREDLQDLLAVLARSDSYLPHEITHSQSSVNSQTEASSGGKTAFKSAQP